MSKKAEDKNQSRRCRALVTGCSSGIGRAIAETLLGQGWAAFLLSDAAASITGQQIVICGGASL